VANIGTDGPFIAFDVSKANALLIAAAPDLLLALHGFVAATEGGLLVCDKPNAKDVLLETAREAIAKAEGRR
jgi:hypothetical protein